MHCLILAGGSGSRLWPLSRSHYPKQFLRLGSNDSFLQKTVRRNLAVVAPENLYIVTAKEYFHDVLQQIKEIEPALEKNILVEPASKNTAPAIAFAFQMLQPKSEDIFLITPADHMISPIEQYCKHMREGEKKALEGYLVTFGIHPTRPETGYGYLKANKQMIVEKFVEKPDMKRAEQYLESGEYFWNSGMFMFTFASFRHEAKKHSPELIEKSFEEMPSLSLDYAVMEKTDRAAMVPLALTWSDIGSWENVYEMLEKDPEQNATVGDVVAVETTNSLIFAQNRLVSTIGLDNILVVETDDVVLIAQKDHAQQVKEVVGKLKGMGKKEVDEHLTTHRPWGSYTVLMESERYKIKRIDVKPKHKLSLQMHYHRSEHWVVVSGTAQVTIGDQEKIVHEGESIFVPKSSIHRLENPGKVPLEMIEVQVGEYLGEDDIVRFEDIYGRIKEDEAFQLLASSYKKSL